MAKYNGIEITPQRIISGLSLAGKSSITFGGRVISIGSPPPSSNRYIFSTEIRPGNIGEVCFLGPQRGPGPFAYSDSNDSLTVGVKLYSDLNLTVEFSSGFYYSFGENSAVQIDSGSIIDVIGC